MSDNKGTPLFFIFLNKGDSGSTYYKIVKVLYAKLTLLTQIHTLTQFFS